jgi:hypothetical protein
MAQTFDRKEKLYQPIRWTNVSLFWILYFSEIVISLTENQRLKIGGVIITFYLARSIIRKWYLHGDNKSKSSLEKIAWTLLVYIGIYALQIILLSILYNIYKS